MKSIFVYLSGVQEYLKEKLGSALTNVYVYGSLINNDGKAFAVERSDIDLLVATSLTDARQRANFLIELRPLMQEIEQTLQQLLPRREFLPITSVCVVTQFELDEGIHQNRNTTNAFDIKAFIPLNAIRTLPIRIGEKLKEDLVQMLYFSAWAVLAEAQQFRSNFVTPRSTSQSDVSEDFDDPFLPLPKDLLRSTYFFYCFAHLKQPAIIVEDDIAKGFKEVCKLLEDAAGTDEQARTLLELIETNRPGGRGDRKPIKSHQLLYIWEILSIKTEEALKERRRDSEKQTFKHSADIVTLELINIGATTLEVVDKAICLYKGEILKDGIMPIKIMPHKEIELYEFSAINEDNITRLAVEWPKDIEDYLRTRSNEQWTGKSECKVGFSGLFYTQKSVNSPVEILVRPLTYWISQQFNKQMAGQPDNLKLREFREKYGRELFKNKTEDFQCLCPSSLYVEVAVVTSNDYVLKLSKKAAYSAMSKGEGRPVFTCGIEHAFSWHSHINIFENSAELNVKRALMDGLHKELSVEPSEVDYWSISTVAIQHAHLNAALLGVVRLSLTRGELMDRIDTAAGYFEKVEFLPLQDAYQAIEIDKGTGKWHQTALMRINLIKAKA